jgi:hypothetical protein
MPKARTPKSTASYAQRALRALLSTGKITESQISAALRAWEKRVEDLKREIAALTGQAAAPPRGARRPARRRRSGRRLKLTPQGRASLRMQGRYMAAVRVLPQSARARIRAIREKSGVKAAIAEAKRMAK